MPGGAVHLYRAPISIFRDHLDTRNGPGSQEFEHPFPVVRRSIPKPKHVSVLLLRHCLPRELPDLTWRASVDIADAGVEASNTTETRSECDLSHRQVRFINQLFRKMQTSGVGDRFRRCPQMFKEKSPQVPRTDAQT